MADEGVGPGGVEALIERGERLFEAGAPAEAAAVFEQALARAPRSDLRATAIERPSIAVSGY